MAGNPHLYWYQAHVLSVYDGDSIRVDCQLGMMCVVKNQQVRLHGINAAEVRGKSRPEGLIVRDYLRELIDDKDIVVRTYRDKKGKFGRWLGVVYLETDGGWLCVNQHLLEHPDLAVVANTYGDKFDGWPQL